MNKLTEYARELRKNQTPQEQKFWTHVRNHRFYGLEFKRQYPIGEYIVDFICRQKKVIVEIDGGQHAEQEHYDSLRTTYLEGLGYVVLRFWNNDIDFNFQGVLEKLKEVCGV